MSNSEELRKIKKHYGEDFMHLCKRMFPTILDEPGKLYEIISSHFSDNSNTLYYDIVSNKLEEKFKNLINSCYYNKNATCIPSNGRNPYEILDEAGYELKECLSQQEIYEYTKYYDPLEIICTISSGIRLKSNVVFFAVKKDVEKIKRKDFVNPQREDKYSTSVLSIQFNRKDGNVQIISRYNHKVKNPNAVYGNDLDKLAPGLKESFINYMKDRKIRFNGNCYEKIDIPGYEICNGKYYKFNVFSSSGICFCPKNIVLEGEHEYKIDNSKILMDNLVLDLKNKTIKSYESAELTNLDDEPHDSFVDYFEEIENIKITKNKKNGVKKIDVFTKENEKPAVIYIDRDNSIIGYDNPNLTEVGDYFCYYNEKMKALNLPNVKRIGKSFLYNNISMQKINISNVEKIDTSFMQFNVELPEIMLPHVKTIGGYFLFSNVIIKDAKFNNLQRVSNGFLKSDISLRNIEMNNLEVAGNSFARNAKELNSLIIPNLKIYGSGFLEKCESVSKMDVSRCPELSLRFDNVIDF